MEGFDKFCKGIFVVIIVAFIEGINKFISVLIKAILILIIFGVGTIVIMYIANGYYTKNNNIIEQDIELQKHNDSLKFKVDNLDSIKNAKVLEVEVLDDDSTISLFYNLIK